ncbi:MAG: hypothetical protein Q4D62_11485 [Planctomycetia bacterium]|nr:hypothetical protein [Planctomycetia bacterium]
MRYCSIIVAGGLLAGMLVGTVRAEKACQGKVIQLLAEQMGQPLPSSLRETLRKIPQPADTNLFKIETAEGKTHAQTPALLPETSLEAPPMTPPMHDSQVLPAAGTLPEDPFAATTVESIPEKEPAELPMSLDLPTAEIPLEEGIAEDLPVAETLENNPEKPAESIDLAPPPAVEAVEEPAEEPVIPVESLETLPAPPATLPPAALETEPATKPATELATEPALLESPVAEALPPVESLPPAIPTESSPQSVTPAVADSEPSRLGNGIPGSENLEGKQTTQLTIEKTAPEEIQVGSPAIWTITVRNEGPQEAVGVQIHDVIPKGAKLASTQPTAQQSETGELTWNVGNMPPGTMAVVKVELTPIKEGTIGSVASVSTRSEASAKAVATRPMLSVETLGESQVLLGDATELTIVVSNPGSGMARNVVLSEQVPAELQFQGGAELLYKVGDLKPGESKTTKLPLTAVRPGVLTNKLVATAEPNLRVESLFQMEVTAPSINVQLDGPARRFLEKEGTYQITLTNQGTASAKNVEIKVVLPHGMKFIRANNAGTFLAKSRVAAWKLEELPARDSATAELVVAPMEIGTQTLKCEAVADICTAATTEKEVRVEGIAALMFQVTDSNDPVQIGEETIYKIRVVNQGSKQAENVQVAVTIPQGLQVIASEGGTLHGNQLLYHPISYLAPKAEKVYTFTAKGVQSGDQRVVVKLSSREFQTPIVKEESTRVYSE